MSQNTQNTASSPPPPGKSTVDPGEIERFSAMAAEWWDPRGKFRPLHKFNPVRLAFIRDRICAHFGREPKDRKPLSGLRVLDIGCGGGLLCEPVKRMGAEVVGADAGEANIKTAMVHAAEQGLEIDYRATTAETLAGAEEQFDVILNMEVIEHVADVPAFVGACAAMLKPDGLMICATLNRTLKSLGLAVIGAEYILRWLPRGTHDWSKFLTPAELNRHLQNAGLKTIHSTGVTYIPVRDEWVLSRSEDVNYLMVAVPDPE